MRNGHGCIVAEVVTETPSDLFRRPPGLQIGDHPGTQPRARSQLRRLRAAREFRRTIMRPERLIAVTSAVRVHLPRNRRRSPHQPARDRGERLVTLETQADLNPYLQRQPTRQRRCTPGAIHATERREHPTHRHLRTTHPSRDLPLRQALSRQENHPTPCLPTKPAPHPLRHHNLPDHPTTSWSAHRVVALTP